MMYKKHPTHKLEYKRQSIKRHQPKYAHKLAELDITNNMLFGENLEKSLETISSTGGTIHLKPFEKEDTALLAILKAKLESTIIITSFPNLLLSNLLIT